MSLEFSANTASRLHKGNELYKKSYCATLGSVHHSYKFIGYIEKISTTGFSTIFQKQK